MSNTKNQSPSRIAALAAMGTLLGFSLSRIGFTSWDEVHRMFTFADLRLFLTFMGAVTLLGGAFYALKTRTSPAWPTKDIHRGTIAGGVLFGVGWALSGGCPGVVLAQLGEGKVFALLSLGGVLLGNWLYGRLFEAKVLSSPTPGLSNIEGTATDACAPPNAAE